jgi:hypothetical protein
MGSIINVRKNLADQYNHFKCYRGEGNLGCAGWGVRDRDEAPGINANTFFCAGYGVPSGARIKYLRFRLVANSGVPANDYIGFAIWRRRLVGASLGAYENIYNYVVTNDVLIENGYAAGFASNINYVVTLPREVYLQPTSGVRYYFSIYPFGLQLDYDLAGTTNGCSYGTIAGDFTAAPTVDIADLTDCDYAISFEIFAEPDSWIQLLNGGSIEEENIGWHAPAFCTTGGPTGWATEEHIYDGLGDAVSGGVGDYIDVDLGAGLGPAIPWDPTSVDSANFPDYAAFGVRALTMLSIQGEIVAGGSAITIAIHDSDTIAAPAVGWQPVVTLDTLGAFDEDIVLPQIARWIRILETGAGGTKVSNLDVFQIGYRVLDGHFYIDMSDAAHPNWVENYPTLERVYRVIAGNMAGAESTPSKPFTNRANLD